MSVNKYNKNADSNVAVGDGASTVGVQEGMPRRDVNNAMRSMAADVAKYADDNTYLTTAGTADVLTVTTSSEYTAYSEKMTIWAKFHAAPNASALINVNNLGEKPLRVSGAAIAAGDVELGGIYKLTYDGAGFVVIGGGVLGRALSFGVRNAANAALAANSSTGSIVYMGGYAYEVAPVATGAGSATSDLSIDGLIAFGAKTPFHYGAVGDGVANDTAACIKAMAGGGEILFPQGTFLIDDHMPVAANSEIEMIGWLKVASTVVEADNFEGVFTLSGVINGFTATNVTIRNARIDLNNAPAANGINIRDGSKNVQVLGAHVKNGAHAKNGYKGGRGIISEATSDALGSPKNVLVSGFTIENCYEACGIGGNQDSPGVNVVFTNGVVSGCEHVLGIFGNSLGYPHDTQEAGWVFSNVTAFDCGETTTYTADGGLFNFVRGCNGVISNVRVANNPSYPTIGAVIFGEHANVVTDNILVQANVTNVINLQSWSETDALPATANGSFASRHDIRLIGSCVDTVAYNFTYNAARTGGPGDANPSDLVIKVDVDSASSGNVCNGFVKSYPEIFLNLRIGGKVALGDALSLHSVAQSSYDRRESAEGGLRVFGSETDMSDGIELSSFAPSITMKDLSGAAWWFRPHVDSNKFRIDLSTNQGSTWTEMAEWTYNHLRPGTAYDNTMDLGGPSNRFRTVYAGTGTINTSDRREKRNIRKLSDAEMKAAAAILDGVCAYQWKGESDDVQFGLVAQDIEAAFTENGLDPSEYSVLDYGDERMGVRYDQALALCIAALNSKGS